MIDELIDDLKSDEGWSPFAYQDHLGYWTIGYGFLVDAEKGVGLPEHIAEGWLRFAAESRYDELIDRAPWIEAQPEDVQRALGNLCYQIGVGGVLKFKKMLAALQAGDRQKAADEGLDSTWAKQTPARAKRVTDLIRG